MKLFLFKILKIFYPSWQMKNFASRSNQWNKIRKEYLKRQPKCAVCKRKAKTVHHIIPFHVDPTKELDIDNLIGFCSTCHHLTFGHLMYWKSYNSKVVEDTQIYKQRMWNRP